MYDHLFKYPMFTEFIPVGIVKNVYTVIGYRIIVNEKGEVIGTYYRCSHNFCGQTIESNDNETTITRGLANV